MRKWIIQSGAAAAIAAVGFAVIIACRSDAALPMIASNEMSDEFPKGKTLEVKYIANEGVLLTSGGKRVLIDGLHREYDDAYAFLPDSEREKIEGARPPFEKIDVLLVSHRHGDHFHPESVGSYLASDRKSRLATSQQVIDEIVKNYPKYEAIKGRVTAVKYELMSREMLRVAGIDIEFLGVGHGSGRHASIQNLGHIIHLNGKRVLHVGDAVPSVEIFDKLDVDERSIDIAILPFWLLTSVEGRTIVDRHIKAKHIIATHVSPGEAKQTVDDAKRHYPTADVFTTMLERRYF